MNNFSPLQGAVPSKVYDQVPDTCARFDLNSGLRLAHFLAQVSHESMSFRVVSENLNYSQQGLLITFGKHFTVEEAKAYARQPERIANRVYCNRMGNGDEASGDGWKFRGRGYIQLTGRANYMAFDNVVPESVMSSPNYVAAKYPLLSAGWFWSTNGLNKLADADDIRSVTKRINGGYNGLEDRTNKFHYYYNLLKNG